MKILLQWIGMINYSVVFFLEGKNRIDGLLRISAFSSFLITVVRSCFVSGGVRTPLTRNGLWSRHFETCIVQVNFERKERDLEILKVTLPCEPEILVGCDQDKAVLGTLDIPPQSA